MIDCSILYNEYENTKDVCSFSKKYQDNDVSTRFLLIRSLDKDNLKEIISRYSNESTEGDVRTLFKKAFDSNATIKNIIDYIEQQRSSLIKKREAELSGLSDIIKDFPIVNCGIHNDKIDDILKKFVRNKTIKTKNELLFELENSLLPRVRQYVLWSYYNQTSNDIIELFFLKHKRIIPTLRKIHDIDFFLKIDNKIIPFDLKFTHISDNYFDLVSGGIEDNHNQNIFDDYITSDSNNEIKVIKAFYLGFKKTHKEFDLPKTTGLEKKQYCDYLISTGNNEATQFAIEIQKKRKNLVPSTPEQLHQLEWWNYKYQGERLFCNNNRLFVFISYRNSFQDGRLLKGKTAEIGLKINDLLDNLTLENVHTIRYHYDKDSSLEGDYSALSISTIFSEDI